MSDDTTAEPLDQIDALLGGGDDSQEVQPEAEAPEADPETAQEPETSDDTEETEEPGEEEEQQAEQIDYDLEVPMPDGREPIKLGALKDRLIELERSEDQIIDRENDIMRRSDELTKALQMAGGEIPAELKQQMQTRQDEHLRRENDAMFQAIPEWKDPKVFETDRKDIMKLGTSYGLSPKEVSSIMDHRTIKFMRDHVRLLRAQETGRATLKRLKPAQGRKGKTVPIKSRKGSLNQQVQRAAASRNQDTKLNAIDALLKAG